MKSTLEDRNYRFLQDYIHRESGIVLDDDKHYLVEARLLPVARESHLASLDALCSALRATDNAALQRKVVEAMTTHETFFFRDSTSFDALRTVILPPLIEQKKTTRRLRFWCGGASSGQEPYSVAMLLLELGLDTWDLNILGTDLSAQILERAREGCYSQLEANRGLPAKHLVTHFRRQGLTWQLNGNVRRLVHFEQFDLRRSMQGKGPFDVILCRNVLIYFDQPTRKAIVAGLRRALSPGGYLILGSTESLHQVDHKFRAVPGAPSTFYQV